MINQQHLFPHRLFMMIVNKNTNSCNLELVKYLQQINDFINLFFCLFVKELQMFAASKKHVQTAICNCTVTVSNGKGLNHWQ